MGAIASSLALAQRFWNLGLSVIPIPRAQPGGLDGKTAVLEWKVFQSRLPTLTELQQWFATEQNIAIICGSVSGIVVVDVDDGQARDWWMARRPYTPWQSLTAHGAHFFYAHPGGTLRNRAHLDTADGKLALDIRADGGYVIAPGSLHASGIRYRVAGDWTQPRERLPMFDPSWLARPTPPKAETTSDIRKFSTLDIHVRARAYLNAIPQPEIGHGSDQAVFYAACRLTRRFALTASEAEDLLWQWCGNRPGWTREWVAQKILNALRHGTEPVGVDPHARA